MIDAVDQFPNRMIVFIAFVILVFGMSAAEIILEFVAGETLEEMTDDLIRFSLSAFVLVVFAYEYSVQKRALGQLQMQFGTMSGRLSHFDPKTVDIANQYRDVMQRQFDAWQLTTSEQEIVILMLKGLSFKEISQLRDTREKTVRQQASSIYRKAKVSNRIELAAWFFEDLLEPN